ncbi:MAG: phosphate ABC transporter permease PstA [Pseudolabrys sp.]|nr:phosphate ABC transporter permease PstA [Pseudolabrys sp.]MDP2294850.1 phosphate ABC transporter permease PstA [Pseudolabrys sp.]
MTEMALSTARTVDFASDAAQARVRARYRAEARFKMYGLIAIGLTALFLVIVLTDIVIKGLPAFTQHSAVLDVTISDADVDPKAVRDGDYQAVVRNTLRARFPNVESRADRRALDGIISTGAADRLRERVLSDPSLIGKTVSTQLLLSDDADLYYKEGTRIDRQPAAGAATVSGVAGDVTIQSSLPDFAANLKVVKSGLFARAQTLRTEAERQRGYARTLEARKADIERTLATATPAVRQELATITADIASMSQRVEEATAKAAELQVRFDASASEETLDELVASVLVQINGGLVKVTKMTDTQATGTVILPLTSAGPAAAGSWQVVTYVVPEANRRVNDREVSWLEALRAQGAIGSNFNWAFFTSGDSREPELAGIRGALVGSALTLFVTLILCLPIGVAAAIYLEEFAPKNWLTEIIEVNINNLAAVPSIVFGLLGLAMFLNFFDLPRSAPLVGGLVLALLVLPTIIIASRAALRAVPPSIKEAALGVGASQQQAVFHHVLPPAMPGIMTGTIIGMAHALGETAPLLMIGMVAFIVEVPTGITDAATALPVQIYLWSDLPEIAFQAKTAAAIMVLLVFLFVMNGSAIYLRRQFERRW